MEGARCWARRKSGGEEGERHWLETRDGFFPFSTSLPSWPWTGASCSAARLGARPSIGGRGLWLAALLPIARVYNARYCILTWSTASQRARDPQPITRESIVCCELICQTTPCVPCHRLPFPVLPTDFMHPSCPPEPYSPIFRYSGGPLVAGVQRTDIGPNKSYLGNPGCPIRCCRKTRCNL